MLPTCTEVYPTSSLASWPAAAGQLACQLRSSKCSQLFDQTTNDYDESEKWDHDHHDACGSMLTVAFAHKGGYCLLSSSRPRPVMYSAGVMTSRLCCKLQQTTKELQPTACLPRTPHSTYAHTSHSETEEGCVHISRNTLTPWPKFLETCASSVLAHW